MGRASKWAGEREEHTLKSEGTVYSQTTRGQRGILGTALDPPPWRAERAGSAVRGVQHKSTKSRRTTKYLC
eukprot:6492554-Pyramimonas_sp.AAC.1